MTSTTGHYDDLDRDLDSEASGTIGRQPGEGDDPSVAPEEDEPTLQDWVEAEKSRPDMTEETADGLDDTDEEIRHQAEDLPLDTPGRL